LPLSLPVAKYKRAITPHKAGFVHSIECDKLGFAVITLGGGRMVTTDQIDFAVGFENPKKIGDKVNIGDPLIIMHFNDHKKAELAEKMVHEAYNIK
jgi:pyrimidine-nucleoside phosphorylase